MRRIWVRSRSQIRTLTVDTPKLLTAHPSRGPPLENSVHVRYQETSEETNLWLPGVKGEGGIHWEIGTDLHTLLYIK